MSTAVDTKKVKIIEHSEDGYLPNIDEKQKRTLRQCLAAALIVGVPILADLGTAYNVVACGPGQGGRTLIEQKGVWAFGARGAIPIREATREENASVTSETCTVGGNTFATDNTILARQLAAQAIVASNRALQRKL